MKRRSLLIGSAALGASGCTPGQTIATLALTAVDAATPRDASLRAEGEAFGPHPRQRLDVYAPSGDGRRPVALFWYGGGWSMGDRAQFRFVGQALAACGIVALIADYRLHPEIRWPAFMTDGAMAVAWARREAGRFGGDPGRIFACGHSAGAHIALLLALDPGHLAQFGVLATELAGVVALAPPTGLEPYRGRNLPAIFGPGGHDSQRPIMWARSGASPPPTLLLAGVADSVIRPADVAELADTLRSHGGQSDFRAVPGAGHLGMLLGLAPSLPGGGDLLPEITQFMGGSRECHGYGTALPGAGAEDGA